MDIVLFLVFKLYVVKKLLEPSVHTCFSQSEQLLYLNSSNILWVHYHSLSTYLCVCEFVYLKHEYNYIENCYIIIFHWDTSFCRLAKQWFAKVNEYKNLNTPNVNRSSKNIKFHAYKKP